MTAFLIYLLGLLAISRHTSATYCVCKDGFGDAVYQKDIDYACGAGADCTLIQQNGACYNPNTVKDHCNYAVNSYFQRKAQATGSCDFSGSATTTASLASQQSSTCVYPSSASPAGTTPTSPTTGTTTPTTPVTNPTTPTTGTTIPPPPATGTTSTTPAGSIGTPASSIFGLGPASITPSTDSKAPSERPLFSVFSGLLLFFVL